MWWKCVSSDSQLQPVSECAGKQTKGCQVSDWKWRWDRKEMDMCVWKREWCWGGDLGRDKGVPCATVQVWWLHGRDEFGWVTPLQGERREKAKPVRLTLSSAGCDTFRMNFIMLQTVMQMKNRSTQALGTIQLRFCSREMWFDIANGSALGIICWKYMLTEVFDLFSLSFSSKCTIYVFCEFFLNLGMVTAPWVI